MANSATVTSNDGKASVSVLVKQEPNGEYVIAVSAVTAPGYVLISVDGAQVWARGSKF